MCIVIRTCYIIKIRNTKMEKSKDKKVDWLSLQDEKLLKRVRSVNTIVYPDGSEGYLKGNFLII